MGLECCRQKVSNKGSEDRVGCTVHGMRKSEGGAGSEGLIGKAAWCPAFGHMNHPQSPKSNPQLGSSVLTSTSKPFPGWGPKKEHTTEVSRRRAKGINSTVSSPGMLLLLMAPVREETWEPHPSQVTSGSPHEVLSPHTCPQPLNTVLSKPSEVTLYIRVQHVPPPFYRAENSELREGKRRAHSPPASQSLAQQG